MERREVFGEHEFCCQCCHPGIHRNLFAHNLPISRFCIRLLQSKYQQKNYWWLLTALNSIFVHNDHFIFIILIFVLEESCGRECLKH